MLELMREMVADTATTSVNWAEVVTVTVKVVPALVRVTWRGENSPGTLKKLSRGSLWILSTFLPALSFAPDIRLSIITSMRESAEQTAQQPSTLSYLILILYRHCTLILSR